MTGTKGREIVRLWDLSGDAGSSLSDFLQPAGVCCCILPERGGRECHSFPAYPNTSVSGDALPGPMD